MFATRIATVSAMVLAAGFVTTGTAAAQDMLFECTAELDLRINAMNHVSGTEELTDCVVVGNPGVTSGTASITGTASLVTLATLVTTTTDVVTWNTGVTTTITNTRTFTGIGTVVEAGTGATVEGLLHPSVDAEAGTGTRYLEEYDGPEQEPFTIRTRTINLITGFFDD